MPATSPVLAAVVAVPTTTYRSPVGDIQFDYPSDWKPDATQSSTFAVQAPANLGHSWLNLDVPKLPWHPAGMISLDMVASGYESDLKKNQIHDAVREEDCSLSIPNAKARRIISHGHDHGKMLIDMAVILIHADRVYILSTDSDDAGRASARKTLDNAVASLKWTR